MPEDAKAVWDSLPRPNCALVHAALVAQGLDAPGEREIRKWKQKGNWQKPLRTKRNPVREQTQPAEAKRRVMKPKHSNEAMAVGFAEAVEKKLEAPDLRATIKAAFEEADRRWAEAESDEDRMSMVSMSALKSSQKMFIALEHLGPELIDKAPEAVGKCYQSISAGLVTALSPIEQIVASRSSKMKMVAQPNGRMAEVLTVEEYDPLAESFKAAFTNGHGARA